MVPGTGLLAACVPGTFESWMLLLRDYGTMRLRDVLEPAIAYARDGYPLVERAAATIQIVEKLFRNHWTTSAAVYLPNDEVPRPGTLFTNKQLAETYARILKEAESAGGDRVAQIERARKSWSQGFVAEAIDKFCRTPGGDGRLRLAAPRRALGRRHGALAADRRGAADLRLWPLHRLQARRLEPGPGDAAAARAAEGLRARRARSRRPRFHPSADRMRQARLRRPREVLRRSRSSPTSRSRRCCRTPTTTSAAS